ncbi:ABC transporter permease [Permianibacter aggregans]|uniref:Putative ABC transport system permease protein n=1 Tax=Permianibacter aggregans TaxID=1510150 RepID=A0A4R6UHC2_9GAMM|nr:ABC transporter permease [Permianibacter aggregans]QGX39932.1 FtsX-like permease family protein [Permianibacter aggregans]TDQ46261.1 putative ABC transport system permease protein [Permianibacter aggregans]
MISWQHIREALEEQLHHKLRTLLTLLGMIFGVGAVIAMLSIGEGAEREALQLIDELGLRNLIVEGKPVEEDRLREQRKHSLGLNRRDIEVAMDTLPFVRNWSAEKRVKTYLLFSEQGRSDAAVFAVSPSYFQLSHLQVASGRLLSEEDDRHFAQVAVLGPETARQLFPGGDAVGQLIKINHVWLRVVGVLADKQLSKSEFQGVKLGGEKNRVFISLDNAHRRFKFEPLESTLDAFRLELEPGANPLVAAESLRHLLQRRHNDIDDFDIVVPAQLMAQHRETRRIFTIVMSCVAGISLLVGGIGIMNIMLASVLERTHEIGLLRAIGARRKDILTQFMVESFTITTLGGLLGIVLGFALAAVIAWYAGWAVGFSLTAILVSVGVCALIGMVFGLYPAMQAAKLDPIVALQRE